MGFLAAPGGRETLQKGGGLRSPPFWKVSRPPQAAQTPKIDDLRSVKKSYGCVSKVPPPRPKIHTSQIPREMALELVSGADFWCKLMSWGAPGRSKGVPASISGLKPRRTGPKILMLTHFFETDPSHRVRSRASSSPEPRQNVPQATSPGRRVLLKDPGVF